MKTSYNALRALLIIANITSPLTGYSAAYAAPPPAHGLPSPQISKALDALLLPVNKAVIKKFKLAKGEHGVLVLSVKKGGVADKQGIKPGDVLSEVHGHKVHKPVDVDVAVSRDLKAGKSDIALAVLRDGAPVAVAAVITVEEYNEAISVTEVSSWESDTSETSFSYSEYVSEETQTIESSYESEETTVEEAMTQEESSSDEETSDDSSEDDGDDGDAGDDDGGDDGDSEE
ncbi:PDZ domain-containing protein [Rhizobium chutanense]|uniref:PDZ domain-containing protein n=1 Tax=Rhizobium chutanense TaxID=2035448 RepID=A0A3S0QLK3_9HYPH|nr:PDZ domain-containing protein [Rhizobium chutanense]RUM06402.1 PDZ domain-containing protein [Rhizobium chutanense]